MALSQFLSLIFQKKRERNDVYEPLVHSSNINCFQNFHELQKNVGSHILQTLSFTDEEQQEIVRFRNISGKQSARGGVSGYNIKEAGRMNSTADSLRECKTFTTHISV